MERRRTVEFLVTTFTAFLLLSLAAKGKSKPTDKIQPRPQTTYKVVQTQIDQRENIKSQGTASKQTNKRGKKDS